MAENLAALMVDQRAAWTAYCLVGSWVASKAARWVVCSVGARAVWKVAPMVATRVVETAASTAETMVAAMVVQKAELSECYWVVLKVDLLVERRAVLKAETTADC